MSDHRVNTSERHAPLIAQLTPEERAALAADLLAANVREGIQAALVSTNPRATSVSQPAAPAADVYAPVMRPEQAAAYCAIGVNRLRDLLRVGVIPGRRSGRRWLVRREALDEWMRTEEKAAEQRRRDVLISYPGLAPHGSDMLRSPPG
jgi:excisionase family DNA binding protein